MYSIFCMDHPVLPILYGSPCTSYFVWITLYSLFCMDHPLLPIMHESLCTPYFVWIIQYSIFCMDHPVLHILYGSSSIQYFCESPCTSSHHPVLDMYSLGHYTQDLHPVLNVTRLEAITRKWFRIFMKHWVDIQGVPINMIVKTRHRDKNETTFCK